MFALLTYVVGDYLAPLSERQATQVKASYKGGIRLGRSGAWLKDHASTPQGERSYSINVGSAGPRSVLHDIRIFEFDATDDCCAALPQPTPKWSGIRTGR